MTRETEPARGEKGSILPFVALMLVVLLGMSALAVDLGWFYLNASRLQRATDSAALAGVVFLPGDVANVQAKAVDAANANGWSIGTVNGVPLPPPAGPDSLTWTPLADNKLQVALTTTIDTFFLRVLGFDQMTITRTATAEYVKPVPLGAPANCIGIGQAVTSRGLPFGALDAFAECNNYTQNFWSAINGRRTALEHGDPYGPTCGFRCSGGNSEFDPYYYFAIEVPAGATWVDVFLYDAGFYDRRNFAETGDEDRLRNSSRGGTHMTFDLFQPDSTPLIPEDNTARVSCSLGTNSLTINSETFAFRYKNRWRRLCRITNVVEGIYVLRVSNGGDSIGGNNSYSILVDSSNLSSAVPRTYSINEMSIFTNAPSGTATVYLAEVDPVHAGKILELQFYDPGEGAGNATMSVVPPPGVGPISCSWTATDNWPGGGPTSGNSCTINSTVNGQAMFNGEWITMQIQIPPDYTCSADCFWRMNLDLNVSHDRTTWKAKVIGNPVRLVPNP